MQSLIRLFIFVVTISIVFAAPLSAQKKSKKPPKKSKIAEMVKLADKYYQNTEYFLAAQEYQKVLEADPQHKYATYHLGESYRMYFHYENAEQCYKKMMDMGGTSEFPLSQFWYGVMLKLNGNYEEAQKNLQEFMDDGSISGTEVSKYKETAEIELKGCKLALTEMKKPVKDYTFENVPNPVNSGVSEYAPVIYLHDSSLVIASSRKESKGDDEFGWLGGEFSDNYRFEKVNGGWEQMHDKDIFSGLHTELNESPGSFTQDKKKFYFTRCDEVVKIEGVAIHECAIYMSENKEDKWQKPVKLNENVNMKGQWNAQPNITAKGDTLYFVSKRPGGYGMHDIWMTTSSGKDDWGTAVNLGPKINTPFVDMSPCYYAKEKTLFFASNGHEGFGGLDIFIAKGVGYSDVKNAGLPFNSNRDDFYMVLGETKGYMASNREGGKGNDDIYWFNIKSKECQIAFVDKDSLGEAKSISIVGNLKVKDTNEPAFDVNILLKDENDEMLKSTRTDETGLFRFENLPVATYKVILEDCDPRITIEVKYIIEDVEVKSSKQVSSRKLFEHIYFDFDKYNIRPEARKILDELVAFYKTNPDIQIEMHANTDAYGTDEYNVRLSQNRGKASLDYLIKNGVKKSALVVNAKGEGTPIAKNNNPAGRQLNRRVEFYIVGGPDYQAKAMAYVVEPKTTLYSVAKKFNMTLQELKELNNLKGEKINAYTPLRVKRNNTDDDIIAPVTVSFAENSPAVDFPDADPKHLSKEEKHKQKELEKLEKIEKLEEKKYPVADEVLDEKRVHYTPKGLGAGEEYHSVAPANTLYSIAHMYGMTVDELKQLNGLKSNKLYVGQKLKVKKDPRIQNTADTYIVKDGDTMFGIAKKFGLTVDELKALNDLKDNSLYENMVLKVKK
ncbi:MAG: LysM peptidoglycan-binding domain-containing protein [Cytophagaceae bacterium]|nr:LysM peptidoglycan-binding domain-containing protein [Cytophagaceae bacterium]